MQLDRKIRWSGKCNFIYLSIFVKIVLEKTTSKELFSSVLGMETVQRIIWALQSITAENCRLIDTLSNWFLWANFHESSKIIIRRVEHFASPWKSILKACVANPMSMFSFRIKVVSSVKRLIAILNIFHMKHFTKRLCWHNSCIWILEDSIVLAEQMFVFQDAIDSFVAFGTYLCWLSLKKHSEAYCWRIATYPFYQTRSLSKFFSGFSRKRHWRKHLRNHFKKGFQFIPLRPHRLTQSFV